MTKFKNVDFDWRAVQKKTLTEVNSLEGGPKPGDTVTTLNRKRALTGIVLRVKKKTAFCRGSFYPGGPERSFAASFENLSLVKRGKRRGTE